MRLSLAAVLVALAFTAPVDAVSNSIWRKGTGVQGSCAASVKGKALMTGPCSGLGHGGSVFVTADRDGCSIELSKNGQRVTGRIFAYRNSCGDLDSDVDLGAFKKDGTCWRAAHTRVCLEAGGSKD